MISFYSKTPGWSWLSNFHPCRIRTSDGGVWDSAEHMYQGYKTLVPKEREWVRKARSAWEAKTRGKQVTATENWVTRKVKVMEAILRLKFAQNEVLLRALLATGEEELVHYAPWDGFWGTGKGHGKNMLGLLLMQTRKELRS